MEVVLLFSSSFKVAGLNDFSHLIQRKRVGEISFINTEGHFGFIRGEDFRDDVFFHMSTWQPKSEGDEPAIKMIVEYEIDRDHRKETDRLRATVVRPTDRPYHKSLKGEKNLAGVKHHPKARKRKPSWRGKK